MPSIDQQTGIDLDLPYDDPAMVAIRQQLQSAGHQMHGSRIVSPQDAQAVARADALRYQNVKPGAVSQRAAAMQQNPDMLANIDMEAVGPRLREMSPETYQRLLGVNNDPAGNTPSAMQADPTQVSPSAPPMAPPPPYDADDQGEMAAPQQQGSGVGDLVKFLFGTAAGAALMKMWSSRGNGMMPTDNVQAPAARQAVEGDFTMQAEPQQGGKPSKTKVTKDTKPPKDAQANKKQPTKAKGQPGDARKPSTKDMAAKFANPAAKKRVDDAKKPEPPKKKGSRLAKAVKGRIKR